VDISRAKIDPEAPTGLMVRERRELGPLDVIYYRRGSAASRLSPADLDADYIGGARYLHLTGITPALSASCRETAFAAAAIARAAGVPVVLDPNLRFKLWSREEARATLRELTTHADIIMPGLEEAEFLTGEGDPEVAARALLDHAPSLSLVVVKLGAEGSLALSREGIVRVPATPLPRVVDPVGAGDAFAAGFYAGQLRGLAPGGNPRPREPLRCLGDHRPRRRRRFPALGGGRLRRCHARRAALATIHDRAVRRGFNRLPWPA
jgi:2-dehydro-3-deoxygluconokinase